MFNNKKDYSQQQQADAISVYSTIFKDLSQAPPEVPWTGTQFKSKAFNSLLTEEHSDKPLYYGISTVDGKPSANDPSSLSRTDANFHTLRAIVLDDINTKVSPELIKLQPTFIIETSSNNYQYIYVLSDPINNKELAKRVLRSFKLHTPIIGLSLIHI